MKTSKLCVLLLALWLGAPTSVQAQRGGQRLETARLNYITREIGLTAEQSEKFWPVFNEYQAKRKSIGVRAKSARLLLSDPAITDEEVRKTLQDLIGYREKELQLQREYLPKFEKVITLKQIARLLNAEQRFIKMLMQRGGEQGGNHGGPGLEE